MRRLVWIAVLAACKKEPRHEGPLRISLGDCADAAVWVSGPRPAPPDQRVANGMKPTKPSAGLTGPGGFDDSNIYGGLLGNEIADAPGGLGIRGSGSGSTGWGTIGTGRYGTIGRGSGIGYGRGRTNAVPTVSIGQPNAQGDLDKAIIRRYIKRNIQKIQYCYEKELLAKASIKGTVQTQFFIKPDGSVAASSASGVDVEVASCVANVIKGIEFPKPKGGGGVQVNYPFTFRPAGATTTDPARPADPPRPVAIDPAPAPTPPEVKTYRAYTPGDANPFKATLPALEDCLRGNDKAYGVATIKPGTTTVQGLSESAANCVGELAAQLPPAKTCSIAFGAMPIAELPAIEITSDAIKFEGALVADPRKLEDSLFKVEGLFDPVEKAVKRHATVGTLSIVGPLVVRAPDSTPIEVITKVTTTIRAAGGDYVFGVADGAAWRTVPALTAPIVPVPLGTGGRWAAGTLGEASEEDELVKLSILIQKDKIWVGLSRVNEFALVEGHDWAKLEKTLGDHRRSVFFAERFDLEVGGEGATYGDLIKAIEVANNVGFLEVSFLAPAGLSARPSL